MGERIQFEWERSVNRNIYATKAEAQRNVENMNYYVDTVKIEWGNEQADRYIKKWFCCHGWEFIKLKSVIRI